MKTKFLKLNKACSEQWENMKPNEKGSFCDVCSKTVIDFTKLNQLEISEKVKKSKGEICARLTKQQLETPLVDFEIQKKYSLPYANIAASLLLASTLTISNTAHAQNEKASTEFVETTNLSSKERINKKKSKPVPTSLDDFITFKGTVCSEKEGTPIKGAKIMFVSVQKMLTTHSLEDGTFSIKIPAELIDDDNVIRVSYDELIAEDGEEALFGYNTEDYILSRKEISVDYKVNATPLVLILGGIGYYTDEHPVVILDGKRVSYVEFVKARHGKKSSCDIKNKDFYYFEPKIAQAIYGTEAKAGLYILVNKLKK